MFRVTLPPGAGSDGNRYFNTEKAPREAPEGDAGSRALTVFVTTIGRVVRIPTTDVIRVEQRSDLAPDGSEWGNDRLDVGWRRVTWPPTTEQPAPAVAPRPRTTRPKP